jgi:HEAT repeat protein
MFKFQFSRLEEPICPTWNCKNKDWTAEGAGLLQPVVYHVWNWMCGQAGKPFPGKCPNIKSLEEKLDDPSEAVRFHSAYILALTGHHDTLLKKFKSYAQMQYIAAYALTAAEATPELVQKLISMLESNIPQMKMLAAFVLCEMGPRVGSKVIPHLCSLSKFKEENVRIYAAEALGTIGSGIQEQKDQAVKTLTAMLDDEAEHVRLTAALSLARIGPSASDAVPRLVQAMEQDTCRYTKANAILALQRIGTPDAIDSVLKHLMTARWCPMTTKKSLF